MRSVAFPLVALLVVGLVMTTAVTSATAVTKGEVDAACADSQDAYTVYSQAKAEFDAAAHALAETEVALETAEASEARIRGLVELRQHEKDRLQESANEQAAELYMEGVSGTASALFMSSPVEAITAASFLGAANDASLDTINDLSATAADLERLGAELEVAIDDLAQMRETRQVAARSQQAAMDTALQSYEQLSDGCRELQSEYQAEQARIAAEEAARRHRQSGSGTRQTISGIVCPFTPGRTQFIDSWGYPRSGGRSHKGADMFAPWDDPVYAVASGTVVTGNYGLGGKIIWLTADNGVGYYYAHLNSHAVESGQRVDQGQLIGYNGNSGNAAGTSPHVHLQIHPSGRGGPAINPYPTVASVCF